MSSGAIEQRSYREGVAAAEVAGAALTRQTVLP
ncbi:MAG: hypothetical protein QOF41_3304, partial [Methylobacteriaceae bacterium]|nr:hypothetical protein [Methylobacteriaceae bacterium]